MQVGRDMTTIIWEMNGPSSGLLRAKITSSNRPELLSLVGSRERNRRGTN
jgi:hypothetical protein